MFSNFKIANSVKPTKAGLLWSWQITLGIAASASGLVSREAAAFTIESRATQACHENVTLEAWTKVRATLPESTAPLASQGDDEALINDLTFSVPASQRSIGPVTLLLGIRDNDIKQFGPNDLHELARPAADPNEQDAHCLRGPTQDEPNGSRDAVAACRQFIRASLLRALDGLDDQGLPDTKSRESLEVTLAIRQKIHVAVPKFFLEAGRGIHAIEDSFAHTFRDPKNPKRIRVVLNYIDYVNGTLVESVDGPAHTSELDRCDNPDQLRTERRALAVEASAAALTALLDPALNRAQKEAAIDAALDEYVVFDEAAHCTADNHWCDAPEVAYGNPTLGCASAAPAPGEGGLALWAAGAALAAFGLRWRRAAALLVAAGSMGLSRPAHASEAEPTATAVTAVTATGETVTAPVTPIRADRAGAFFGRAALGGSYDYAGASAGVGLRYQLNKSWMIGIDGEWNPYIAITAGKLRTGSANAYFSVIRRYQLVWAPVNMRTTASVGGSMLLFDLVGAAKYDMGPFFGLSFLGVELKLARGTYLTIDPVYIALPLPHVTGVPFLYKQYRFLVGIEFGG